MRFPLAATLCLFSLAAQTTKTKPAAFDKSKFETSVQLVLVL